jgi:hypothetical protein
MVKQKLDKLFDGFLVFSKYVSKSSLVSSGAPYFSFAPKTNCPATSP